MSEDRIESNELENLDDIVDAFGGDNSFLQGVEDTLPIDEAVSDSEESIEHFSEEEIDKEYIVNTLSTTTLSDEQELEINKVRSVISMFNQSVKANDFSLEKLELTKEMTNVNCIVSNFFKSNTNEEDNKKSLTTIVKKYINDKKDAILHYLNKCRELVEASSKLLEIIDARNVTDLAIEVNQIVRSMENVYVRRPGHNNVLVSSEPFSRLRDAVVEDNNSNPYFEILSEMVNDLDFNEKSITNITGVLLVTLQSVTEEHRSLISKLSNTLEDREESLLAKVDSDFELSDETLYEVTTEIFKVIVSKEKLEPTFNNLQVLANAFDEDNDLFTLISKGVIGCF